MSVFEPVMSIAVALGADQEALKNAQRIRKPTVDLMHKETAVVIEVDEIQHFTSHRLTTFDHYPLETPFGL
ncbi:hypothetical protein [Arthrobacter sp. efr-133-TYG-118]|uniref:hypothetical protein n=1 Tax=Arthrobacter sp. efr-133-TYG-118 TaxID=3040279 RepID=UPI00254F4836|nr:hypothetical protein [Arthrobacter sp. efr-133-TYG-118]